MAAKTAKEQLEVMGDFLNANIPSLPEPFRTKFSRVIDDLALKTVTG